jgi:hypothetical protein
MKALLLYESFYSVCHFYLQRYRTSVLAGIEEEKGVPPPHKTNSV